MRAFESLFNGHKSEILLKKNNYVYKHFIIRQYVTFNVNDNMNLQNCFGKIWIFSNV